MHSSTIMSDRRSLFGMLVGVTLCVSIWHISTQEPQLGGTRYESVYIDIDLDHSLSAPNASSQPTPTTTSTSTTPAQSPVDIDQTQLIDIHDFKFLINQPPCDSTTNSSVQLLILVHSAPKNWAKRKLVRSTWGQTRDRERLLFVFGSVATQHEQLQLEQENRRHGDILQGKFVDAYRNMTYKHAAVLKWFTYFCPSAQHLLKTDDDVFVHTPNLRHLLSVSAPTHSNNLLMCIRTLKAKIARSYRSKWRVSFAEYPGVYYPTYCPGYSIVYSADVVRRLYRAAQITPYFWIDDIHMTGTLALAANVTITPMQFGQHLNWKFVERVINKKANKKDQEIFKHIVFTSPNLAPNKIESMWRMLGKDWNLASSNRSTTEATTTIS